MKKNVLKYLIIAALFAALITVTTGFIGHIPIGTAGGYLHFGDSLIYLCSCLIPFPFNMIAAMIGGGLADLLTAPAWVVPTIIIKALATLSFTSGKNKIICARNIIALIPAAVLTIGGYYIAEAVLFGNWATPALSIPGNAIQAGGSIAIFLLIAFAFDRIGIKKKFFGTDGE